MRPIVPNRAISLLGLFTPGLPWQGHTCQYAPMDSRPQIATSLPIFHPPMDSWTKKGHPQYQPNNVSTLRNNGPSSEWHYTFTVLCGVVFTDMNNHLTCCKYCSNNISFQKDLRVRTMWVFFSQSLLTHKALCKSAETALSERVIIKKKQDC